MTASHDQKVSIIDRGPVFPVVLDTTLASPAELRLGGFERLLLWSGLTLRFLMPNSLLNLAYPYSGSAGAPILKIHPGSYLLILALCLFLIRMDFVRIVIDRWRRNAGTPIFMAITATVAVTIGFRFGIGNLAYLIDTFLVAAIAAILLAYVERKSLERLTRYILYFILANSIIALVEYGLGTKLTPYGAGDVYFDTFRSSAFLGHPLTNALVTSSMLMVLTASNWPARRSWIFALTYLAAIMAFGARAAFAVSLLMVAALNATILAGNLARGRLRLSTATWLPFAFATFVAVTSLLLFSTTLGSRILSLATFNDGSANARFKIGTIFGFLQPDQFLWGLAYADRVIITDKNPYFSIIENFWVALILNFGIVMFVPFALGLLIFLLGAIRRKGLAGLFVVVTFLLVASANNSLSTKTPDLVFVICAVAGLRDAPSGKQKKKTSQMPALSPVEPLI